MPKFIFVVCQNGSESACKAEIARNHPQTKLAFSRPGFITFKVDDDVFAEKFFLQSTLARTWGWSVGNAKSDNAAELIDQLCAHPELKSSDTLHLWQRDWTIPGAKGFEPGVTELVNELGEQIKNRLDPTNIKVNRLARTDEKVFDVNLVEPNQWWFGYHYAMTPQARWPGGVPSIDLDENVISRAHYKLQEALLWSGIVINKGDVCAEIGSSPGGACQLLLEKEAKVIAVDPAVIDPSIADDKNLTFLRCRGREVRKKDLKNVRWLLSDLNATPTFTLDTIQEIVQNQNVSHVRGLILTLKITDDKFIGQVPDYIARVKSWGFQVVKTRQLAFNRNEICLVAVKDKFALRSSRQRKVSKPEDNKGLDSISKNSNLETGENIASESQTPVVVEVEKQDLTGP